MRKDKIRIGTRGSDLALWQANYTRKLVEEQGYEAEICILSTQGDISQKWNTSFEKLEGKGFFTKELEEALLTNEIDVAVHSHKDLPTENPKGLIVAGVSEREDPSELLLIRKEKVDERKRFSLAQNAVVGTSSARRKAQMKSFRSDVEIIDLRGNVPTRINKLKEGVYDAILLAYAGVERLKIDLSDFHVEKISPEEFVPAPAQGVLAWQIRESDEKLKLLFQQLSDFSVESVIALERRVLNLFDGGCQLPLGVYCRQEEAEDQGFTYKIIVSKAETALSQPLHFYFETKYIDGIAEKIVDKIKNVQPCSVFITKNFRAHDFLPTALNRLNYICEGKSLIEFKSISFETLPKCDWIFFSSKHAVKYFFQHSPKLPEGIRFGCISKATAIELRQFGYRSDFIGQSTDTKLIGKQFSSVSGNSKVLFPVAQESLQSIQKQMVKKENAINLPVYKTIQNQVYINPSVNIVVFTSPSNVDAFFSKNKWVAGMKAVAMGDATAKALERKGVRNSFKTPRFDDLGLFMSILSI